MKGWANDEEKGSVYSSKYRAAKSGPSPLGQLLAKLQGGGEGHTLQNTEILNVCDIVFLVRNSQIFQNRTWKSIVFLLLDDSLVYNKTTKQKIDRMTIYNKYIYVFLFYFFTITAV